METQVECHTLLAFNGWAENDIFFILFFSKMPLVNCSTGMQTLAGQRNSSFEKQRQLRGNNWVSRTTSVFRMTGYKPWPFFFLKIYFQSLQPQHLHFPISALQSWLTHCINGFKYFDGPQKTLKLISRQIYFNWFLIQIPGFLTSVYFWQHVLPFKKVLRISYVESKERKPLLSWCLLRLTNT